ncbi:hypothetical protein KCP76_10770 [Salmonella enterica subsp. enterica serovar Weltevreden]|nr:hypothetical protein KCP76_10770 [Salmonella enterica subsp. enterica serovar Weltevreden]
MAASGRARYCTFDKVNLAKNWQLALPVYPNKALQKPPSLQRLSLPYRPARCVKALLVHDSNGSEPIWGCANVDARAAEVSELKSCTITPLREEVLSLLRRRNAGAQRYSASALAPPSSGYYLSSRVSRHYDQRLDGA